MKKFIIIAVLVIVAVVAVNKANASLHERNVRAVKRSIAVDRLAGGTAPMQQECEQVGGMVFRVDPDTGITRCQGVAGGLKMRFSTMLQTEAAVMAVFDEACLRDGGVMIVEKTINENNTTVLACTESRFQMYWTSK